MMTVEQLSKLNLPDSRLVAQHALFVALLERDEVKTVVAPAALQALVELERIELEREKLKQQLQLIREMSKRKETAQPVAPDAPSIQD